jgi:hypothetical protein
MLIRSLMAIVLGLCWCVAAKAQGPASTANAALASASTGQASSVSPSALRIDGLTVASDNPVVPPVVTATLVNAGAAAQAVVWWHAPGEDWQSTPMSVGPSGLALARLPDGLQQQGFSFYVEVTDVGATNAVGSRVSPMVMPAATEGNVARVAAANASRVEPTGPDPAVIMVTLVAGVLVGAGAGIFGYDLSIVNGRTAAVDAELARSPAAARRAALVGERKELEKAATQDAVATVVLSVVGGAALVTGAVMLTVGALEQ